jgi:hypothetical protein
MHWFKTDKLHQQHEIAAAQVDTLNHAVKNAQLLFKKRSRELS